MAQAASTENEPMSQWRVQMLTGIDARTENRPLPLAPRPRAGHSRLAAFLLIMVVPLLVSGCRQTKEEMKVGAGNYCSLIDRVLWTSNADSPAPPSGPAIATFNIFIMDSSGGHRAQLTGDSWPTMNQHPVFTPDCQQIVWARGKAGESTRLWIMNKDGKEQKPLSSPPAGEEDGHPWVGGDRRVYFVRHQHASGLHRLWRMNLDGSDAAELIGGQDRDRVHPNLRGDGELVLYTATAPGSAEPTEIRVFNQKTKEDKLLYAPGWAVSGAIWHPDGDRVVLAEKRTGPGSHYRIVEIGYPSGSALRTLIENQQDNTIPYYAYPSGAAIDWVQWPGVGKTRNVGRMNADGSGQALLTNDTFENTKILGEFEFDSSSVSTSNPTGCHPKPVGCNPVPPPCGIAIPVANPNHNSTGQNPNRTGGGYDVAPMQ
jgi:Tol biopolymer transport system component